MEKFEKSKIEDLKNSEVPESLYWSVDQVCSFFVDKLNLPEYTVCYLNWNEIIFYLWFYINNYKSKH